MQQRLYHIIPYGAMAFCFALLVLVTACGGQDDPVVENEDKLELSDKEICIEIDEWKPMTESRASIFESQDDFLYANETKTLGNDFTLYAFTRGSDTPFINGTRVNYQVRTDGGENRWRFYAYPNYIEYYWPQTGMFDFFALMPYGDRQKNITKVEYNKTSGNVILTCQMQTTTESLEDPNGQETIFAYTKDLNKESGNVNMHFVHPFSAVNFKLEKSHSKLKINSIKFENIYLGGSITLSDKTTAETNVEWTPTGSTATFTIPVDKAVGEGEGKIYYGDDIGENFLVMPQTFTDQAKITITYTWRDEINSFSHPIKTNQISGWEAGNKYLYKLSLGDNTQEEIFLDVEVVPWAPGGAKNEIDVE